MLSKIRIKIRALIGDSVKPDFQIFTYTNSNIFTLAEPNISQITKVLINGNTLGAGQSYIFDSLTAKITITGVSFNLGDILEVDYAFTKYGDSELNEFIRASLSWLSIFDFGEGTFEINASTDDIFPNLADKESDLIALVASILVCPDYTTYRLPNLSVIYPAQMPKEDRITKLITRFKHGIGAGDVIHWGNDGNYK